MHSLKKEIICHFTSLPSIEGLERNQLIVYTAAGVFAGTPVLEAPQNGSDIGTALFSLIENCSADYRSENHIPDGQLLDGNDGAILLSDVTLISGQSRINIPTLAIFFDQIIGISIGTLN